MLASLQYRSDEKKGIARPVTLLSMSSRDSWIAQTFADLGLEIRDTLAPGETPSRLNPSDRALLVNLQEAAKELCARAHKLRLNTKCVERTQGIAAAFAVLSRAQLPAHWIVNAKGAPTPVTLAMITDTCQIRRNTVQGYLGMLSDYHSKFAAIYEKHGLDASRQ